MAADSTVWAQPPGLREATSADGLQRVFRLVLARKTITSRNVHKSHLIRQNSPIGNYSVIATNYRSSRGGEHIERVPGREAEQSHGAYSEHFFPRGLFLSQPRFVYASATRLHNARPWTPRPNSGRQTACERIRKLAPLASVAGRDVGVESVRIGS